MGLCVSHFNPYHQNRLPSPTLDHASPCIYAHKLSLKSKQCILVQKIYVLLASYDPVSQHIYPSRNVAFDESCFPAKTRVVLASPTSVTLPPASPVVISLPQQIFAATSPSTSLLFVLLPIELSILSHTTFPQSVVGTPSTTLNEASVEFGSSPGILWSLHPIFFFQIITCIILPRV